ncbi:hypothetical protein ACP4OV_007724 [Aristida adscensionis]
MDHRRAEGGDEPAAGVDLSALLPGDVLAEVLRRAAPRDLALLPRSVGGILINFLGYFITELFSRPPAAAGRPSVSGKRAFLPVAGSDSWAVVLDHCNGLLLVEADDDVLDHSPEFVLNPATRWFAPLPSCPPLPSAMDAFGKKHLAYDPAISPHYTVISITYFGNNHRRGDPRSRDEHELDPVMEQSEWPPSVYALHVFSSATGRWEERWLARQGEAACRVADLRRWIWNDRNNAAYWRGHLYVHCQSNFFMRISLADDKCQVIKAPAGIRATDEYSEIYLGKSEKGVYCAAISDEGRRRIRFWVLNESSCQMEWEFRHDSSLNEWMVKHRVNRSRDPRVHGPSWSLEDINCYYSGCHEYEKMEAVIKENFEWSLEASEDEDSAYSSHSDEDSDGEGCPRYIDILGFHPYKEIVYLSQSIRRGLAYHLSSSRVQVLGNLYPARYDEELPNERFITSSFPYMPSFLKQT